MADRAPTAARCAGALCRVAAASADTDILELTETNVETVLDEVRAPQREERTPRLRPPPRSRTEARPPSWPALTGLSMRARASPTAPAPAAALARRPQVRPYLMADGGNVELVDIDGLVVRLRLQGACGSCPSSLTTMTMGIKRRLMERIPEILEVEQVQDEEVGLELNAENVDTVRRRRRARGGGRLRPARFACWRRRASPSVPEGGRVSWPARRQGSGGVWRAVGLGGRRFKAPCSGPRPGSPGRRPGPLGAPCRRARARPREHRHPTPCCHPRTPCAPLGRRQRLTPHAPPPPPLQVLGEIRPYLVGTGGGGLELDSIDGPIVKVKITGPAANVMTVRVAVTQKLREKIKAIAAVQLV